MRKPATLSCCLLALSAAAAFAYDIPGYAPDQIVPFKQTLNSTGGAVTLNLHVFTPPGHQPSHKRPVIVFFFGGGWVDGSASHFHPQCEYLASRGMVAISAEYRVKNLHGTTPQECVKDGKSAIRYVRQNAATLGIDPDRIAAGGGSAGGQVAAAAGTLTSYEEAGENLAISSKPNALVLFNPVVDNGPGGYGYSTVQAYWQDFSPLHNITASAPPSVFFLGTSDALIPVSVGTGYQAAMETFGLRCDLHLYEGQGHSFFNFDVPDDGSGPFYGYQDTLFKTDEFLVSLGYLPDPHADPSPVTGWVTVAGDAGFAAGSAATDSPVTTDADGDAIAAGFSPVTLTDGGFLRLSGTVTLSAPLAGGNFRVGLFHGDQPVTAGVGTGYTGIWAGAPDHTASVIASGTGTGSQPFEPSTTLGPVPAAGSIVPAGTPVAFSLMIARNGGNLDIAAGFTGGASYRASQNLLHLAAGDPTFDRAAFLLGDALDANQASFSNIRITSGPALPSATPPDDPPPAAGPITYLDASVATGGNTFRTGNPADTTWLNTTQNSASTNNTQWVARYGADFGIDDNSLQSLASSGDFPGITTRITGLDDGTYAIHAFFWEQVVDTSQNWGITAGLSSGSLTTYSAPLAGHSRPGTNTADVSNAADLAFTTPVKVAQVSDGSGGFRQNLFAARLGEVTVSGGSAVDVFIDNHLVGTSNWRIAYDGIGYQPLIPASAPASTRVLGVDFNRDDALGAPSQSGFRVISGSAASQASNSASHDKTIGTHQITVSQPDGVKFEFRGANTDSTRAIPGGDTSLSFLVSDFIATREGAIDIGITGLAAGGYRFRSWHLDTITGSALGFAQGSTTTSPNTIECQIGGLTRGAIQPTALGSAGLNTTFLNNTQIPTLDFRFIHEGGPLTLKLRALQPNGGQNFLLMNGFELLQENP